MPSRQLIAEHNGKSYKTHSAIKWLLTLLSGALTCGIVIVLMASYSTALMAGNRLAVPEKKSAAQLRVPDVKPPHQGPGTTLICT